MSFCLFYWTAHANSFWNILTFTYPQFVDTSGDNQFYNVCWYPQMSGISNFLFLISSRLKHLKYIKKYQQIL